MRCRSLDCAFGDIITVICCVIGDEAAKLAHAVLSLLVVLSSAADCPTSPLCLVHRTTDLSMQVFVDFFAEWCGPCKMVAPKLDALSKDLPGVTFLKVDVDECQV